MLDKSKKTGDSNWDPQGKYKTALEFNRARLNVIKAQIEIHFGRGNLPPDYSALSIIDIGSGGGLISEPLAKLGAQVTGIDASAVSVEVAKRHAQNTGVKVDYQHKLSSEVVEEGRQYDVVINAEVVEHVPECASLVKPGGLLILATLNRTLKSYVVAIVGAEYVMRYLPIGTHDWKKFVKPSELKSWIGNEFTLKYQLNGEWLTTSSLAVNYVQAYSKHK